MAKKFGRMNDEHQEVEGMPEYEPAVHTHTDEVPTDGELNYSKWVYGDQRYGDGEQRHDGFAEPGEEGAVAIKEQIELGGIGGHRRSEHIDRQAGGAVVGDEHMPGDGHGGSDHSGGNPKGRGQAAGQVRHTKGRNVHEGKKRGGSA